MQLQHLGQRVGRRAPQHRQALVRRHTHAPVGRMAEAAVPEFGIAMFCGMGHAPDGRMGMSAHKGLPVLRRATPDTLADVLELHRAAASS